jgi:nitrile hydratase accessory protein
MSSDPVQPLPPLPDKLDRNKAYANPWQARAIAIAIVLHESGHLDWQEWTRLLAEEIARAEPLPAGPPDDGEAYYLCCIAALERASAAMIRAGA